MAVLSRYLVIQYSVEEPVDSLFYEQELSKVTGEDKLFQTMQKILRQKKLKIGQIQCLGCVGAATIQHVTVARRNKIQVNYHDLGKLESR